MKALLIVNPSSGGEEALKFEEMAREKLESLYSEVKVVHTEKELDATKFSREAACEGYDSVFAMGGDGTVNEAISGLAEQENRPRFGFFPLGTVNDLARALHIPLNPEEAIANLSLDTTCKIDIGKINQDYFMNVVAIGMVPAAVNHVGVEEKTKLGKMAYVLSGLREIRKNESYHFQLTIDGQTQTVESSTLIIGSSNSIGGFEQLLPEASSDDGKLHLIYIKDSNLWETIKSVPDLLTGVTESSSSIGYLTFEEAEITVVEPVDIETNVDGDSGDSLPVKIQILPHHLEVFCGA